MSKLNNILNFKVWQVFILLCALAMLLSFQSCVDPYEPELNSTEQEILVVESVLMDGETTVKLHYSSAISNAVLRPVKSAKVFVTSESGNYTSASFTTDGSGTYAGDLQLNELENYVLHVELENGETYQSDAVPVKDSPPIQSLDWEFEDRILDIYVSTSDQSGASRYYRYEYVETWQYSSAFQSYFKYENDTIVVRQSQDQIHRCWYTVNSSNIELATSTGLTSDVIYRHPVNSIDTRTETKLNIRYSILLRQYVLTEEAFEFWRILRENTEGLGGIFDAQPSQLPGNLTCVTNPAVPVIGFISAGNLSEHRIFIVKNHLSNDPFYNQYKNCVEVILPNPIGPIRPLSEFLEDGYNIPIDTIPGNSRFITASSVFCVDCREAGGVTERPDFW